MIPQAIIAALMASQGRQGGGMGGSLPFPRPGMPIQNQAPSNDDILGALGGGGTPPPMPMPQMGGAPGIGMGRMPIRPNSGGSSPLAALVRQHFANQPRSPGSAPMGGMGGRMPQYR